MKVGILGSGQLAQMLLLEAYKLGLDVHLVANRPDDCALSYIHPEKVKVGLSKENLDWLSERSQVVSLESEFLNLHVLRHSKIVNVLKPGLSCLEMCQSKLSQKRFLKGSGLPTLPFQEFESLESLLQERSLKEVVIKKAHLGYDGKGVFKFRHLNETEVRRLLAHPGDFQGYIEPQAHFKKEISVVIARSKTCVQTFPVVESRQENGICMETIYPASISPSLTRKAVEIAKKVITKAQGIGVFGVEMFVLRNNEIVVNEIAPRVHNTGHWTLDGSSMSQFEMHWRALLDWPLTEPRFEKAAVMVNIIGQSAGNIENSDIPLKGSVLEDTHVYWYGKRGEGRGRKLGHINAVAKSVPLALKRARKLRKNVKI